MAILLCDVCARVCVSRYRIIYGNINTLNGLKIDLTIFFAALWQKRGLSDTDGLISLQIHLERQDHDITRNTFRSANIFQKINF